MTNPTSHQQTTRQIGDHGSGRIADDYNSPIHIDPKLLQLDERFDADEVAALYRQHIVDSYNKLVLPGWYKHSHNLPTPSLENIFVNLNLETIKVGEDPLDRQERMRLEQELEQEKQRGDQADKKTIDKIQNQLDNH